MPEKRAAQRGLADSQARYGVAESATLKDRIAMLIGPEGPTAAARRWLMSLGAVQKYLAGTVPSLDRAANICRAEKVRLEWLATGEGPMREGEEPAATRYPAMGETPAPQAQGFVFVPRFDIRASAGPGLFNDHEQVVDHLAFRAAWVRRTLGVDPHNLVLITAMGDSMEPTIRDGDLLLIDTSVRHVLDDAIYVIAKGDALVVKRLHQFFGGAVLIKGDNPLYPEETLQGDELQALQVAGRVRWIGRLV